MVRLDVREKTRILLCGVIPTEIHFHTIVYQQFPARLVDKNRPWSFVELVEMITGH
jgi:hypothetical protein